MLENGDVSGFGSPYKIYIMQFTYTAAQTFTIHFPFMNPDANNRYFSMRIKAFIGNLLVGNMYKY